MEFKLQGKPLPSITIKEEDGASTTSVTNYGSDSVNSGDLFRSSKIAKPLYIQHLERALSIDGFLRQVNSILGETK